MIELRINLFIKDYLKKGYSIDELFIKRSNYFIYGDIIKKIIFIFIFSLLLAFPKGVYAYTKIEYYDFAYIMSNKGYHVDFDGYLTSFDGISGDSFSEKYYF